MWLWSLTTNEGARSQADTVVRGTDERNSGAHYEKLNGAVGHIAAFYSLFVDWRRCAVYPQRRRLHQHCNSQTERRSQNAARCRELADDLYSVQPFFDTLRLHQR